MRPIKFNDYVKLLHDMDDITVEGLITYPKGTIGVIVGMNEDAESKSILSYFMRPLVKLTEINNDIEVRLSDVEIYSFDFDWDDSKCDKKIYDEGNTLCLVDASKTRINLLVKNISIQTNHKLDWHYCGGRAVILVLPNNKEEVLNYVKEHEKELFDGITYCWI